MQKGSKQKFNFEGEKTPPPLKLNLKYMHLDPFSPTQMSEYHLIPLASTQKYNVRGAHSPLLTEAQYSEKGQLYSELEGSATPHSYSLKRGSQFHSKKFGKEE